jgi:hypothetical protein
VRELAAFVSVSEEVCDDCDDSAESLTWNMPSRTNNLQRRKTKVRDKFRIPWS